jgi:RHS repeat-associated protein
VEGRLITVTDGSTITVFTYDGDGKRIKQTVNGSTTTVFIGNYYEQTGSNVTKYYYANSQRVAMRTTAGVTYIHSDHLRSTSATSGAQSGNIKYFPYGATRSGAVSTAYRFTGQRLDDSTGLYYYGARYYDAALGRFISADTIVPNPSNPQSLNRYSYVLNNPLRYTDPTGHMVAEDSIGGCDEPPPPPPLPYNITAFELGWLWLTEQCPDYVVLDLAT